MSLMAIRSIFKSKLLPIGVSVVLLFFVFRSVNLVEVSKEILALPPLINIFYIALMLVIMLITSLRWQLILTQAWNLSELKTFFSASMMGLFYSLFLPSGNGGDILKWTLLSRQPFSKKKIVFSVLYDRLTGLTGLILLGTIGTLFSTLFFKLALPDTAILAISGLFICALFFLGGAFASGILLRIKLLGKIPFVSPILLFVQTRRRMVFYGVLLTILSQFLFFLAIYSLSSALGLPLSLWQLIVFGSVIFIFAALPISFSGFGTTELAFLYFFLPLGATKTQVLSLTTLLVVYKFVFAGIGWLIGTKYQASHLAYQEKEA